MNIVIPLLVFFFIGGAMIMALGVFVFPLYLLALWHANNSLEEAHAAQQLLDPDGASNAEQVCPCCGQAVRVRAHRRRRQRKQRYARSGED
ncbi:hypothetical protein FVQ98_09800 [Ottowia sp. GY511]|uniref:Uncharacterized protein n=1 Tax=Ottowia flava TaxID=2675430 RepID=A0ABW4KQ25_9BURK|nr:hypothetical protein [Ottowia sp. GY511]TXK28270.1 hypothetical protein FVQ98_09800 [Ottowia sp. GY511]